jgi:hypothetical protein
MVCAACHKRVLAYNLEEAGASQMTNAREALPLLEA